MSDLASKTCVPCKGGVPPLAGKDLENLAKQVPQWKVVDGNYLVRMFTFPDFRPGAGVRQQSGRDRGGAGASPGHFAGVGEGGSHYVDAQNQWIDRERFYFGGENRQDLRCRWQLGRAGTLSALQVLRRREIPRCAWDDNLYGSSSPASGNCCRTSFSSVLLEFLTGALTEAEQRVAALSVRAVNTVERATVACLRVDLHTTIGQGGRAIAIWPRLPPASWRRLVATSDGRGSAPRVRARQAPAWAAARSRSSLICT